MISPHSREVCRLYRQLLKTIRVVFKNDPRMKFAGNVEARITFEKFRSEADPEKLKYLLSEAQVASDFLYRELVQVNFDTEANIHKAKVEHRHLKYEDGTHVHEKSL